MSIKYETIVCRKRHILNCQYYLTMYIYESDYHLDVRVAENIPTSYRTIV